ncbi:hypothetical protein [Alishewanella longhuensis]
MFDSSFRQQASAWQRQFQLRQQGSFFQRLLAWLVLGVMLLVGAFFLLFALVLSWILIPILLFRHRRRMRQFREQAERYQQQSTPPGGNVIEGEVLHKDESERR